IDQDILGLCENRLVLFDNKTKDETKRVKQVQDLLSLVNMVMKQNGGQPYTDELFAELKVKSLLSFTVESKMKETTARLEQQLAEEQAARLKAEEMEQLTQMKLNDEILKLRENLERAQKETEELRKQAARCTIL
ncbi:immune-associated nucleotide-binding protein 9-like, partial [Hibiscus syriacus]|uniref:immune-associated nucleotide-binding protein 9-like n=1 Tax=Hibiscus syriacus TaxID=106335 RepID=UPI0019210F7F